MRIYNEKEVTRFIERLRREGVDEIELPPNGNPYEIFRYRREEFCQDMPTGGFSYGFIYRNNKGRYTLVAQAEEDFLRED